MPVTVYQLAKSLGVTSEAVVRQLTAMGAPVRSASSRIPTDVAWKLRTTPVSNWIQPRTAAGRPSRQPRTTTTPDDPLAAAASMFDVPRASLRPARPARPSSNRRTDRPAPTTAPAWQTPWLQRLIDPAEIRAWVNAGLTLDQHATADELRRHGVTPALLATPLSGRTAADRLRAGEPTGQVIARLQQAGRLSG